MRLLFPTILIVLDVGAAVVYGFYGDWRMFTYWMAAAVLSISISY